jgi:ribosomal-protein-alanine N-acetyltransferase
MIDIPVLKTERLKLRPWRITDAEAVYDYAKRPEATRFMLFETHRSIQDAVDFVASAPTNPFYGYAVTIRDDDRAMGGCGLHPVVEHKKSELGYILHPDIWGDGYATEIVRELIRFGFEELHFQRIYARADERNIASWRVMEKAGMQREALLRHDMIIRGEPVDHYLYAILKSDWPR